LQISRHQDDMIEPSLFLMPEANHTGVERHVTLWPHMLHAPHPGNSLLGSGRMRIPLVGQFGQSNGLLCRQHVRFERDDDLGMPGAFYVLEYWTITIAYIV